VKLIINKLLIILAFALNICLSWSAFKNGLIGLFASLLLIFLGGALNILAMAANNWKMPVLIKNSREKALILPQSEHTVLIKTTKLKCLCDQYRFNDKVYSIGDAIIYLGFGLFLISSL